MNRKTEDEFIIITIPDITPPRIVAITGVCKCGCIQAIKRNINPSVAIAYNTRGNGKREPSSDVKMPKNKIRMLEKKKSSHIEVRWNKPVNAPIPTIYLKVGK